MAKELLDAYCHDYDLAARMPYDPVSFPHRYEDTHDKEAAALVASSFAYGKAELFLPHIGRVLSIMGQSPGEFLKSFDIHRQGYLFEGISYRFNRSRDVAAFIHALSCTVRHWGSLKSCFLASFNGQVEGAIAGFCNYVLSLDLQPVYGTNIRPAGFVQLFPLPGKGSACKRLNMFLRWMVRDSEPDLGLWREIPAHSLVIPLDTHIARITRCLGLTQRKSNDWKTAVEITEALKCFDSVDPLKYDFALSHHGISGQCRQLRNTDRCKECTFTSLR